MANLSKASNVVQEKYIAYVRLGQGCSRHGYAIDAHICMHVHMQVVLLDPGGYCTTAQFRSLAHASDGDAKIL